MSQGMVSVALGQCIKSWVIEIFVCLSDDDPDILFSWVNDAEYDFSAYPRGGSAGGSSSSGITVPEVGRDIFQFV